MRAWSVALLVCACAALARGAREERLVRTAQGPVRGYKEDGQLFAFYGIPYATAPTGEHRFKAPLPGPTWLTPLEAVKKNIACLQVVVPGLIGEEAEVQENCLVANIFVPDTTETNLPVAVYVHGGAFQIGSGLFLTAKNIVGQNKFIMVSFNYRLGVHGFLCLGTEDVPGNAGMKDQVALLRWVKENIASFGGNPNDVTIWGSSAGSSSVDLLMLSPATKGLFNKVIPESGSNLGAFSVQTDPIANAKEYAKSQNFSDIDNISALEEFYKSSTLQTLYKDAFLDRKDSTFLFAPCVERNIGQETFLEESPFDILKSGNYEKVPMLYGFSEMEGLFRLDFFDSWKNMMNEKFSDFLLPDLQFQDEHEKLEVVEQIKQFYFADGKITNDQVLAYIDYFTDVIFAYSTLRSVKMHLAAGHREIYLYEYNYVNENNPVIPHTNNVRGANHCAQSAAIFDGLGLMRVSEDTLSTEIKEVKAYMRELWSNFIVHGTPVPEGSGLPAWPAVSSAGAPHMSLGRAPALRREALLERRARFWDGIYERHYRAPQPPQTSHTDKHTEL